MESPATATEPTTRVKGRGLGWCFTLNNFGDGELEHLKNHIRDETWGIIAKETAPNTTTPHLQGAVLMRKRHTLQYMRGWNNRAHWEPMMGTPMQSKVYCSKQDENPWEHGACPDDIVSTKDSRKRGGQGARTDIDLFAESIRTHGIQATVVANPGMYMKYASGAEKLHARLTKQARVEDPRDPPTVIWCYGPTGSGKTRWVRDQSAILDQWWSGKNLKWWDGYDDESVVIIDDFRRDFCTFHELLRILDRYEYRIEVKHGSTQLRAKWIYITSAFHPRDVYEVREDIEQLIRRISKILYFGSIVAEDVSSVINYPGKHVAAAAVSGFVSPPEPILSWADLVDLTQA